MAKPTTTYREQTQPFRSALCTRHEKCGPVFLRAARTLSLPALILFGFELCGSYELSEFDMRGFSQRDPLASPSTLKPYIASQQGRNGVKAARRALSYVLPRSASPQESALAMLLSMPCALGGYGLGKPALNYHIALGPKSSLVSGNSFYSCDLYWPDARLCVEYDSDQFHTGSERIAHDSARRNTLSYNHIDVITVTRLQMSSFLEFDRAAHAIARHLGKRIRPRVDAFRAHQEDLRRVVLGTSSFRGQNLR